MDTKYNKEELLNNPVCFCSYIATALDNILLLVLSFCCPCMMLNWNHLFSPEQKAFREGCIRNHKEQANKNPFIFNSQKLCALMPSCDICHWHSSPKIYASLRNRLLGNVQKTTLGTKVLSSPAKLTQGTAAMKFSFPFAANVPWL